MLSVLRGTDDTIEVEDILNSNYLFIIKLFLKKLLILLFNYFQDQRDFSEHNKDLHSIQN